MQEIYNCNNLLVYHDLIESIVAALEARDLYTANHSRRVSDLSERLCRYLDIDEKEKERIHIAAHVHDIGKIGIPDYILLKTNKLTDDEWEIMKSHCKIGANILSKSKLLKPIIDIVFHHHERYDGKGYPNKLSGEAIPMGARVLAVCDSTDAMLSRRAYRNPLNIEECKREILKNKGAMYDCKIAQCMLDNWDKIVLSNMYINE